MLLIFRLRQYQLVFLIILAFCQFATLVHAAPGTSLLESNNNSIATGLTSQQKFLPVDDAFKLSAIVEQGALILSWDIAPGYYLYRHRLKFEQNESAAPLAADIPVGRAKHDDYFGDVEVYYNQLRVSLRDSATTTGYRIAYQGCADAGLCYPPQTRLVTIDKTGAHIVQADHAQAAPPTFNTVTREQAFSNLLSDASIITMAGLFLLAGLALTFTPCVLPMIPIISSIVVGREQQPGQN